MRIIDSRTIVAGYSTIARNWKPFSKPCERERERERERGRERERKTERQRERGGEKGKEGRDETLPMCNVHAKWPPKQTLSQNNTYASQLCRVCMHPCAFRCEGDGC